jgi:tetratricopeptide (TPR) repeat protein
MKKIINTLIIVFLFTISLCAQSIELPRVSPKAEVIQHIGLSKIEINYSRPGVRGREVWGKLVPYNNGIPFPWRAGANENTTIYFSDDAQINGEKIDAGTYGFHIIPSADDWTLIFNKQNKSWGSFFYDSSFDALRLKVKPIVNGYVEWLEYGFNDFTSNSTTIYMKWEKLKIEFLVKFNETEVVLNDIRQQLLSLPGFGWEGPMEAATFCLENNTNYDEAIKWIDLSISRNPNFQNKIIKVGLLKKTNKLKDAETLKKDAFKNSSENELNLFGYQLLNKNKIDEALEVFELNMKRHPKSWNCIDSYGESLLRANKKDEAINYYKRALEMAPENQKVRIKKIIEKN